MSNTWYGRVLLAGACTFVGVTAWGQAAPPLPSNLDVAVVYHPMDANLVGGAGFWMQGASVQVEGRFWRGMGAVADFSLLHTGDMNNQNVGLDLVTAAFGPRYTWSPRRGRSSCFGQFLVGEVNGLHSVFPGPSATTDTANSLALHGRRWPQPPSPTQPLRARIRGQLAAHAVAQLDHQRAKQSSPRHRSGRPVLVARARLESQVHDTVKQGLVTPLIAVARAKGVSAYVGEGQNRWPAAHVTDVARLYLLALEKGTAGARYHAVAEEGVALKDIATAISRGLNVPVLSISREQAQEHFGFLGQHVSPN
jgi:hypothetical protein